jgi:hypothetical protein
VPGAGFEPTISGSPIVERLVHFSDYESGALARLSHPGRLEVFIATDYFNSSERGDLSSPTGRSRFELLNVGLP